MERRFADRGRQPGEITTNEVRARRMARRSLPKRAMATAIVLSCSVGVLVAAPALVDLAARTYKFRPWN